MVECDCGFVSGDWFVTFFGVVFGIGCLCLARAEKSRGIIGKATPTFNGFREVLDHNSALNPGRRFLQGLIDKQENPGLKHAFIWVSRSGGFAEFFSGIIAPLGGCPFISYYAE